MTDTLIKTLEAVKAENFKVLHPKGYVLLDGWVVRNTETGKFLSWDGVYPYLPAGGKRAAKEVAEMGVYDSAKTKWLEEAA